MVSTVQDPEPNIVREGITERESDSDRIAEGSSTAVQSDSTDAFDGRTLQILPNGVRQIKMWQDKFRLLACFGLLRDDTSRNVPVRVYQVWPGKNVFFFRGRVVCGPDPRGLLLTMISIVLSDWIFGTYIAGIPANHSVLIFTSSVILTTTTIASLVLASTRDPGIVPRNGRPPFEAVGTSTGTRSMRTNIDGIDTTLKYCRVCMIFRPPRCRHCAVCDNCVEKFDHHCPWIGQCIGLRNYRYYMVFLILALAFFSYMFAFSCWRIESKISGGEIRVCTALLNMPETIALALFSFVAVWFLGGLAIYHFYLVIQNQTAYENFNNIYAESPNPYDKGMLQNIKEALFSTLPPSRINFRAVVESPKNEDEEEEAISLQVGSDQENESLQQAIT